MDIERWWQRLTEGVAETDGRRSNRVTRKPRVTPAPAVMQIVASLVSEKAARRMTEAHIRSCVTCTSSGSCADGRRLSHLAAHTRRTGPARRKADMEREEWQERREQGQRLLHESQWATAAGSVREADIQRAHDALVAMLRPLSPKKADGPQLSDWERAEAMSAITMLATKVEQLSR
ncbi:hypothetical protein [Streptomyces sp. NBC_01174]|uniref:hypothetical protein n=1 Tax=Streptomyces sp. NBC_01174 TaxID=2903758 RepID=UPI002F90E540|nr:hypothetical protein OG414_40365 [Streptomyces sp. NBC_01174]